MTMTFPDIARIRLHNQHILKHLADPLEVVRSLGAVQAQEFLPAKWALSMRSGYPSETTVQQLFDDGQLLRTHMLRPTWHFVLPEDIIWIQRLTAPRVQAFNKYYYRKVGLDDAILQQSTDALLRGMPGKALTRLEIKALYEQAGLTVEGQLPHLLMHAELEAIICSGPMRGKQHTYMLVRERAPQAKVMTRQAALAELTRRFFTAHGPATIKDFAWWSSLTTADIKEGIRLAGLSQYSVDDAVFYYATSPLAGDTSATVQLLSIYDEFTVAYRERRPTSAFIAHNSTPLPDSLLYHLLAVDGQIAGGWRTAGAGKPPHITVNLLTSLSRGQLASLITAINQYQTFLGKPVAYTINPAA